MSRQLPDNRHVNVKNYRHQLNTVPDIIYVIVSTMTA
jgi:hypothetical protein